MNELSPNRIYEVQKLIDKKIFNGKTLYLVKWKNFPIQEATWQCVKVLENVKDKIREFKQSRKIGQDDNANNEPSQQEYDLAAVRDDFKKKRGRPKKYGLGKDSQNRRNSSKISKSMMNAENHSQKKRGRGRPKKIKDPQNQEQSQAQFHSLLLQNEQSVSKKQQKQLKKNQKSSKKVQSNENSDYQPSQQDNEAIPKLKNDFYKNRGTNQQNFGAQSQYVSTYRQENHELTQAINRTRSKTKKKDITISIESSSQQQQNEVEQNLHQSSPVKQLLKQKHKSQELENRKSQSGSQNSQSKQKENQNRLLKSKSKKKEKSKEKNRQESFIQQAQYEKKSREKSLKFGIISKFYVLQPVLQKSTIEQNKKSKQANKSSVCQYLVQFQDNRLQKVTSQQLLNKMMSQQKKDSFKNISTWIQYLQSRFKSR